MTIKAKLYAKVNTFPKMPSDIQLHKIHNAFELNEINNKAKAGSPENEINAKSSTLLPLSNGYQLCRGKLKF